MLSINVARTLKRIGAILGVLAATFLVGNAWFTWHTDVELEHKLTMLRKAGDPSSLAELAKKAIPPERNAFTLLRQAEPHVDALEKKLSDIPEAWQYPMPSAIREVVENRFDAYPNVIRLLKRAAACPAYDAELNYALPRKEVGRQLFNILRNSRSVIRVLYAQTMLQVAKKEYDEALRTVLASFRLIRHFNGNPFLCSYATTAAECGIAIEAANVVLQAGPVSMKLRDALNQEIALLSGMAKYDWAVKSERAYAINCFRTVPARNFWILSRWTWNRRECKCLDFFQDFAALSDDAEMYDQVEQAILRMPKESWTLDYIYSLATIELTNQDAAVMLARIRSLRVLNALQTKALAGTNAVPSLGELSLPVEMTTDPFSGWPLQIKKVRSGWVVYSVGPNLLDDGGRLDNGGDVGVGPLLDTDEKH